MTSLIEPDRDCPLCPRLVAFREEWREREPGWHNAPVPSFGDLNGRLILSGLAPGLRGANRTGRPFTGDYAGELLFRTLLRHGFARGTYRADPEDGFELVDAAIVNGVRCVPPQNKPTGDEIRTCRRFLAPALTESPRLRAIVALGRIAHDTTLRALGLKLSQYPFAHGAVHDLGAVTLYDSYHSSRYNTNTGVLTDAMFDSVFAKIRADLDRNAPPA